LSLSVRQNLGVTEPSGVTGSVSLRMSVRQSLRVTEPSGVTGSWR
jgi:hypothetical protein